MKTLILAVTIVLLASFSCGSENKTESEKALEKDLKETVGNSIKTAEQFSGKLDEMLTLNMAANVSGLSSASAKKDYTKMSSFESLKYEWPSDRTKNVEISANQTITVPVKNTVELSWVKNTTLEQFKHDYHNPTPEELKKAEEAMNQKINEMQANNEVSQDQANAATKEANRSISKFSVSVVPNVGDYAVFVNSGVFGANTRDLKVFYKGLSFTITADLSDDAAYNDKKCIETARKIIREKLQ